MDTMLSGLDFAIAYQNDILLESENPEELKKNVFRRIQDYGFKLKEEKCEFYINKIKYLGQVKMTGDQIQHEPVP